MLIVEEGPMKSDRRRENREDVDRGIVGMSNCQRQMTNGKWQMANGKWQMAETGQN